MPQGEMHVLWWSEERTSDYKSKFSSQMINPYVLAQVSISRSNHRIHEPRSSPWYLGLETFSTFFLCAWNLSYNTWHKYAIKQQKVTNSIPSLSCERYYTFDFTAFPLCWLHRTSLHRCLSQFRKLSSSLHHGSTCY
jgi:hypothetical protein